MDNSGESRQKVVILGGGVGGTAILEMLLEEDLVSVVAVVDSNDAAPAMIQAREMGIQTFSSIELGLEITQPNLAFNVTGSEQVQATASEILGVGKVIGGMEAKLILRIIDNVKEAREELRFQASHDALTGLRNRRYLMEMMHQGVSEALRYQTDYSVVMIDLDHFKQVNDSFGHDGGDKALLHVAGVLKSNTRDADSPGRWGGEEFLVLLPHTDRPGAEKAARLWLRELNAAPLRLESGVELSLGFSAGVASLDGDLAASAAVLVERLLQEADGLMYRAKEGGRNRVVASQKTDDSRAD